MNIVKNIKIMNNVEIIDKLNREKKLESAQWHKLISSFSKEDKEYARNIAQKITEEKFGNKVFFRGIIEFSNICNNDCLYCGIRHSNDKASRYCLTKKEIMLSCKEGYKLGYRTFVLQGGENEFVKSENFINLIRDIKSKYPDCAITLSVGECERKFYEEMYLAGADRYLLRHESADEEHYKKLHPKDMSLKNRIRCLRDLKEIGFQTGCGIMVGSPYQTPETLVKDMEFICEFNPAMVGIGPFIPHKDTPFANFETGSQDLTLFLLSLIRIMNEDILLPATTALGTVDQEGLIKGIQSGCNVIMPNVSPQNVRKKYMLYNEKLGTNFSAKESLEFLKTQMKSINREIVVGRGDHKMYIKKENN